MALMGTARQVGTARLAAAVAATLGLYAAAAMAQTLPESVQACRKEADDARRLQCFDRETARYARPSEQDFGLTPGQASAAQKRAAGAAPGEASAAEPAGAGQLTATVRGLRLRPHAGFIVTLDNGQVWKQNEAETSFEIREGDVVTIKPGRMGGYWLVGRHGLSTHVRRLQ